jgi:putative methionine-R-sulfoxide reductase with GAF domain/anti-sigma regulatory factor (Ser/Thr protein kinase)
MYLIFEHELTAPHATSTPYVARKSQLDVPHKLFKGQGITWRAVDRREIINIGNVPKDAKRFFRPAHADDKTMSELAAPVNFGQTSMGTLVLNIESDEPDAFRPRDEHIAELLALSAGVAYADAEDFARKVELFRELTKATSKLVDNVEDPVDAILEGAMNVAGIALSADEWSVKRSGSCALIMDKDDDHLWIINEKPDGVKRNTNHWPIGQGTTSAVFNSAKEEYFADVRGLPKEKYVETIPGTVTNWVIPLPRRAMRPSDNAQRHGAQPPTTDHGPKCLGVLIFESPDPDAFEEDVKVAIREFVPLVVAALEKGDTMKSLILRQGETVDRFGQFAHLFSSPIEDLVRSGTDTQPIEGTSVANDLASRTEFLRLMVSWLRGQTNILRAGLPANMRDPRYNAQEKIEHFDLADLVAKTVQAYQYQANKHNVILENHGGIKELWTLGHKTELQGALVELLANAVKYTARARSDAKGDAKPKHVSVRLSSMLDNHAVIEVEDEGIGVPLSDYERITQRGERGGNVGDIPGTGLGLYFVTKTMDLYHGRLDVCARRRQSDGKRPEGARFILEFSLNGPRAHDR